MRSLPRSVALLLMLHATTVLAAVEVRWRVGSFANRFWIVDQISAWSESYTSPLYREMFEKRFGLTTEQSAALRRYAEIRSTHSRDDEPSDEELVRHPLGDRLVSPAPLPFERFAAAFFRAESVGEAGRNLGLSAEEIRDVKAAFAAVEEDVGRLLEGAAYLHQLKAELESLAQKTRLGEFLEQAAAFFGVSGEPELRYIGELLWAPPGHGKATVYEDRLVLPFAEDGLSKGNVAGWLGVAVHELGHGFVSRLPDDERYELTKLLFERYGIVNQRHHNVLDEATHTALGNILFMRERLPEHFDDRSFYSYEPHNEYPYAIDSMARELEPVLRKWLAKPGAYPTQYIPAALEVQARLFGQMPKHHTHVGLVLTGSRATWSSFRGLFWGVSRLPVDAAKAEEFARASNENPTQTRWVVLTLEEVRREGLLDQLGLGPLAKLRLTAKMAACTQARRRRPGRGYDFYVLGRDQEALRRMLIALHSRDGIPERRPFCIPPATAARSGALPSSARGGESSERTRRYGAGPSGIYRAQRAARADSEDEPDHRPTPPRRHRSTAVVRLSFSAGTAAPSGGRR